MLLPSDDTHSECSDDLTVAVSPKRQKAAKTRIHPERLHFKEVRSCIRVRMVAQVPGISLRTAKAIMSAYPTFAALMKAPLFKLEALEVRSARPLGPALAKALRRVIQ